MKDGAEKEKSYLDRTAEAGKSIKMKSIRIVVCFSILLNVVLGWLLYRKYNISRIEREIKEVNRISSSRKPGYQELASDSVFRKIFIEKNDSSYRDYFGKSFEKESLLSFMLASTYYLTTKSEKAKEDINAISVELKGIYGTAPKVNIEP